MAVVPFWLNALGKIPEGQSTLTKGVLYTNPHMGMFGVFKEAEMIKERKFVVKLRWFLAKIDKL